MLCYRCGSHVADGVEACGNCGQSLRTGGLDKAKLTGSFEVLKRRQGAAAQELSRRDLTPGTGALSPEYAAKRLRAGDLVSGRYEIRSLVGRGPAGIVYRALDQEIDDDVALKVIRPDVLESDEEKERFVRVLRKARRLSQQNIVRVYDVEWDKEEDLIFYTSQYLEGLTLRKVLDLRRDRGQFFELREVEPIISQICLALQHAHKSAVHGGLKPDNIVILPDLLKITDFYLAEALGSDLFLRLQDEAEVGDYVAPELRDGRSADIRSDLFSLGAMLTEMICGAAALSDGDTPSTLNANLSAAEDELHARAAAPDPENRYRNAEEFSEDVTSVIDTGGVLFGDDLGDGAAIAGGAALSLHLEGGTLLDPSAPSTGLTDPHVLIEDIRPLKPTLGDDEDRPQDAVLFDDSARRKLADHEGSSEEQAHLHRAVPTQEMIHAAEGAKPASQEQEEVRWGAYALLIAVVISVLAYGTILLLNAPQSQSGTVISVPQPVGPGPAPAPRAPPATVIVASGSETRDAGVVVSVAKGSGATDATVKHAGLRLASVATAARTAQSASSVSGVGSVVPGPDGNSAALEPLIPPAPPEPPPPALHRPPVQTPAPAPKLAVSPPLAPTKPPVAKVKPKPPTPARVQPRPTPPPRPVPPPPPIQIARPTPQPRIPPPPPKQPAVVVSRMQPALAPASVKPTPPVKERLSKCPGGMAKIKKGKARIGSSKRDAFRGFEGVEQRVEVDAYCVDRYEYPGKGRAPMTGITFKQAGALCGARGLRLCTDTEWERACKGPRGYRYPYGNKFNADRCVTEDKSENPRALQSGGSFKKCRSGYAVYDMSGNAAEWSAEGHLRGGTATKPDYAVRCAHKVKKNRAAKDPFVGFRCCADAK